MEVLIISANGFEDSELIELHHRLKEEGVEVKIASRSRGRIAGMAECASSVRVSPRVSAGFIG